MFYVITLTIIFFNINSLQVFPSEEPTVAEGVVEEMIAEVDEAGIDRAAVEEKAEEVSRTVS